MICKRLLFNFKQYEDAIDKLNYFVRQNIEIEEVHIFCTDEKWYLRIRYFN